MEPGASICPIFLKGFFALRIPASRQDSTLQKGNNMRDKRLAIERRVGCHSQKKFGWLWSSAASPQIGKARGSLRSTLATLTQMV